MSNQRSARHLWEGCPAAARRGDPDAAALMSEPGQWAWPSWANYHGGVPVLGVTLALGFDEAGVPALSEVAFYLASFQALFQPRV